MNILIVDDEPLARAELGRMCAELFPDFRGTHAATLSEARSALLSQRFDGAFIDLELAGSNGLELLPEAEVTGTPAVVVTAHEDHALNAFEGGAFDYLLKPVEPARLFRAIRRFGRGQRHEPDDLLLLSDQTHCWPVHAADIVLAESDGGYTVVKFDNRKELTVSRPLKELEHLLAKYPFIRANRSQLVNLRFIQVIHRQPNGRILASVQGQGEIEFSRRQTQALRGRFAL